MSNEDIFPGRKQYRRKKRHQGGTWTPKNKMADKPDGVWCRVCGKRHGYMTMTVNYEKRKTGWVILWICPVTGNVIGEQELSSDGQGSS